MYYYSTAHFLQEENSFKGATRRVQGLIKTNKFSLMKQWLDREHELLVPKFSPHESTTRALGLGHTNNEHFPLNI